MTCVPEVMHDQTLSGVEASYNGKACQQAAADKARQESKLAMVLESAAQGFRTGGKGHRARLDGEGHGSNRSERARLTRAAAVGTPRTLAANHVHSAPIRCKHDQTLYRVEQRYAGPKAGEDSMTCSEFCF